MSTEIPAHPAIWSRLQTEWQTGRLPHALLFVGAAGLGKAATAWRLAARMLGRELRVTPAMNGRKTRFISRMKPIFSAFPRREAKLKSARFVRWKRRSAALMGARA